jgi:hypothetical protein
VIPSTLTNALAISGARVEAYPYFDLVFWSDNEGWQHIKWDTSSRATLQARANDRAYYRETREQDLWRFPNSDRFRVDTIFSRNTGEYLAVISRPAPRFDICPGRFLAVESMITPLLSLVRPVVPPDYGFAVIDTAGSVLFHSTATKNGQENFFAELADDNSARGAVLGKRNQHFFARYNGVEHRFYATPFERLENAPWALVAFHDLSARSAQNFERTVLFSALVVAYCALVAFIILAIPFGTRAPVWIWPQAQAHATYIKLVITLALLGVAFYLLADDVVSIFDGGFYRLLAAGVLLPFLSMGVVMCALESRMRGSAIFLIAAVSVLAVWPQEGLARQHWAFFPVVVGLLALRFRPMGEARSVLVSGGVLIAIGATWRYGHALPLSILALAALPFLPPIGPWIERWARSPMRKSTNPRSGEETAFVASYTAVWVLTLMLSGVVANVAFFKVAYDLHEYISRRLVQVETINSLIDREDRVRRRYSAVSLSGPGSGVEENETYRWLFIRRRLEQTLDRYDTAFMGSTILDPAFSWGANSGSRSGVDRTSDGPPSPFESHRDMWYAPHELPQGLVRIASYVPFGLGPVGRQLGVVSFSGRGRSESDSAYSWTVVRNRIRISRSGEGELGRSPATMALRKAVENDPTFISSELVSGLALFVPWDIGVSLIVFAAGCGLAFVWIKRTLESIFVTRVPKEDPIPELSFDECTGLVGNNILLVEEFGRMDAALAERDDVRIIDFADVRRGGSADERAAGGTSIVVNGLDLEDRDPEADIRALELIELLRRRFPSANVLIVATINPVFLFEQGGELGGGASREDPTLRDRWARALSGFSVYRAVARTDLPPSMRHRLAWSACATTERVALYQLAREGWANPRNLAAYQHLFRRGVLGPAPYDFVDEEFRRFVRDSVGKAELKSWEREETASLWDGIRMMFVVLAIGLVVTLLFLNQQSVLGLVVSAGGALTAFLKLFTEARGLRSFLGLGGGGETA